MERTSDILPSIARMKPGDHYCGIFYGTDEDHRAIVVDFVRQGIERGEKMFYLVNVQTSTQLEQALAGAGIHVYPLLAKGQLVISSAKDVYLRYGEFDPARMIELLREETGKARAEGYPALRVTGEMTWALQGEPGSERVLEYESLLNRFFPTSECYAVCQYDRRRFDAEMLVEVLQTHPHVLYGRDGFDNSRMYFMPPEPFLGGDRQSAILERWLENLSVGARDDS